jgi:MFS family permease
MEDNKRLGIHYAWWIMVASAAIYAASVGIIVNNAGLLYNAVAADLEIGIGSISFYTTIMYLTITFFLPFSSRILARFDLRRVLTVAGIMNALAFGLMSIYTSVWQFYLSGFILGLGSTFLIYGTVPIIINNWFKVKEGTALGIAQAFMGIGGAISAPLTGYLIETIGWRPTYVALGVGVAILILPFSIFVIREKPSDIGMQPLGVDANIEGSENEEAEVPGVKQEDARKSVPFVLILIFTGLFGLISTVSFHVPNFAQSIGFAPTIAATAVTAVTVAQTVGKFLIGWVNDRFGTKSAVATGITGGLLGIILLLFSNNLGLFALYIGAFLFGLGYSASTLLPPIVITATFGRRDYAPIYTSVMSVSTLGVALGTTLFGYLFDLTGSYYVVFITVMILFAIALISSFISINWKEKFIKNGLYK